MILRILQADPCGPHRLWLALSDVRRGAVDCWPLLSGPVFEPLQDPAYFARFALNPECGTVTWPNGADFAPEALHGVVGADAESATMFDQL